MLESKFLFISKVFFLVFIIINIPSFFPLSIGDPSYWFLISTTILDTTTLLVLSLSISKYINLKNLKLTESLHSKDSSKQNFIEKINLFKTKNIQDRKLSFILFIFFLILTLIQPIILILDLNKNDVYSSAVIESLNRDFDNKKRNIKEVITIQKKQTNNKDKLVELEATIANLSNIRDKNIEQFLNSNTKNKFKTAKIIIRNLLLALLWTFVFYKLYRI